MKKFYAARSWRLLVWSLMLTLPATVFAQDEIMLGPVSGTYAIKNVNIIQAPGRKIDMGTVVIKDGLIVAVGKNVTIPADAILIKADSMYVYAGFIDGLSHTGVTKPKEEQSRERLDDPGNPPPDKAGITPQQDVRTVLNAKDKSIEEMRNAGFTTAQVVPYGSFLPGTAAIIQLVGTSEDHMVLTNGTALYSELSWTPRSYPSTVIGVMAKYRELYRQAALTKAYASTYASNKAGLERPQSDRILEAFYPVIDKRIPVLFKAEKVLDAQRVAALQADLGFSLVIADLKEGWDIIPKLQKTNAKFLLSLDLPDEVKDKKDEKKDDKKDEKADKKTNAEQEALEKRKAEFIAKYTGQAAAFQKAGVKFGFSTMSVKAKDIPANLRRMIKAGLSEDAALAALTVNTAEILGLSDRLGTVDNGKIANLVITDKPYFDEKAKIRYVFVDGQVNVMEKKEEKKGDPNAKVELAGSWSLSAETPQGKNESKVTFKKDGSGFSGTISGGRLPGPVDLSDIELSGNALKFKYTVSFGGNSMEVTVEGTIEGTTFKGSTSVGQFGTFATEGSKDPQF